MWLQVYSNIKKSILWINHETVVGFDSRSNYLLSRYWLLERFGSASVHKFIDFAVFGGLGPEILVCQIYHIHFEYLLLWNYSVQRVIYQWLNLFYFRADVIIAFPLSPAFVTKLISTDTCHMNATFFLFYHEKTTRASLKLVIPFHKLDNISFTVFVFGMSFTQTFWTVSDQAFLTKQIIIFVGFFQLDCTIWTVLLCFLSEDVYIIHNSMVSLPEFYIQLQENLGLGIHILTAPFTRAFNQCKLILYSINHVVFQTFKTEYMGTIAHTSHFLNQTILIADEAFRFVLINLWIVLRIVDRSGTLKHE